MSDLIALITIMLWPVVPLFWIPVHCLHEIFKRLGLITYGLPLITSLPFAYFIYIKRSIIIHYRIELPLVITMAGILLLIFGTLLHVWTGKLLGIWGLIGLPEISGRFKAKLVTEGPFSVVRHPTYLAHTIMFTGIFLITGVIAVGLITVLDLLVINLLVIPLEEREISTRFGEEYERYRDRVPRFFPRIRDF